MKRNLLLASCIALFVGVAQSAPLPTGNAILTAPPMVPPPITCKHNAKMIVKLETVEKVGTMTDSVEYVYWSFGGTVPGSIIRLKEGNEVTTEAIANSRH